MNRRADVGVGNPAPNPECKTGTLAQKQEVGTAQMLTGTGTGTGHIAFHNLGGDFTDGLADNDKVVRVK